MERSDIDAYNYATFDGTDDFLAFRTAVPIGSDAPDFGALLLDGGASVRLSDYWAKHDVLIEFGSFT